jgi:hypothetical protein
MVRLPKGRHTPVSSGTVTFGASLLIAVCGHQRTAVPVEDVVTGSAVIVQGIHVRIVIERNRRPLQLPEDIHMGNCFPFGQGKSATVREGRDPAEENPQHNRCPAFHLSAPASPVSGACPTRDETCGRSLDPGPGEALKI